jgi:signal transduction histidine kinase/ActR/RegA family two-component response regulator
VTQAYLDATMTERLAIVGRGLFEVFPDNPDDEQATGELNLGGSLRHVIETGEPHTMATQKYDIRRPDGSFEVRYWSPVNSPVLDANGKLAYIIHRVEDVSALVTVNDQLKAANLAKDEFLSRMSHELRTPLTAVSGFSELLTLAELQPRQREWAGLIRSASQHLSRLIDDVLDISRIAAGQLSMSLEPVALGPLLHDVVELLRPLAGRNDITLEPVTSPGGHGYAFADSRRLKQVMINLVVNAIKYNRRGGSVQIRVGPGGAQEELIRIAVTDTGHGMRADAVAKLFVPFERLDAAESGIEGIGLGLALSRNLVETMRGQIGVDSVPGQGSTFWVELARGDEVTLADASGGAVATLATREYSGARRVLYVEDTLANIRLIEAILHARPQVELLPAMQGQLGLDLAREHLPDLILLDIHLPDLDGDEVLARLQADPATREIPTVVLSADATDKQKTRLLEAGAVAYLTKPIDVARLLETLDQHLTGVGTAS